MDLFRLPLTHLQTEIAGLPLTATQALSTDCTPTKLILHARAKTKEYHRLREFFSFFDERLRVEGVAKRDGRTYWVLVGKTSSKNSRPGSIFIPVTLETETANRKEDQLTSPTQIALSVLRDAFDTIDARRDPFTFGGTPANEYIDFEHRNSRESRERWQDSLVLYTSIGGDALLVKDDGTTAWFQLETHEIFSAGDVRGAIDRYIRSTIADREFSSWTDGRH